MDWECGAGGILRVLEIIEDHKPAFIYDFRSRFGLGLGDLGTALPWSEVVYLVAVLVRDPSSWLQTSLSKWHHPIDYNWAVNVATYDLLAQVNTRKGRKAKPYPRPWPAGENGQSRKGKARADARAILSRAKNGELNWQNRHTPM